MPHKHNLYERCKNVYQGKTEAEFYVVDKYTVKNNLFNGKKMIDHIFYIKKYCKYVLK